MYGNSSRFFINLQFGVLSGRSTLRTRQIIEALILRPIFDVLLSKSFILLFLILLGSSLTLENFHLHRSLFVVLSFVNSNHYSFSLYLFIGFRFKIKQNSPKNKNWILSINNKRWLLFSVSPLSLFLNFLFLLQGPSTSSFWSIIISDEK